MNKKTCSIKVSIELKELVDRYCKKKRLKVNSFVEKLIIEALEEEIDLEIIEKRESEETINVDFF